MTALRDTLARLKAAYAQIKPGRIEDAWVNDDETLAQMNFGDDLREAFPQIAAALDRAQRVEEAAQELLEVADLRGDSDLPHPADDPKLWTARAIDAWDELRAALAPDEKEQR